MTRPLFAALTALSLALAGGTPARALENEDLAKMLLGVAAAALVGHAIDQRQDGPRADALARAEAAARDAERAAEDARIVEVARRAREARGNTDFAAREARGAADFAALARRQAAQAEAVQPQAQHSGRSLSRWVSSDPTWTGPIWPGVSEDSPMTIRSAEAVPRPAAAFRDDHPVFGRDADRPRGKGRPQGRPFREDGWRPAPGSAATEWRPAAPVAPAPQAPVVPAPQAPAAAGARAPLDALATLPAHCLDRHETGSGTVRILGQACLADSYRFYALLPSQCLREVPTVYGPRYGHDPSCLRAEGFVVPDPA